MVYLFLLLEGESDELLLAGDRLEVVLWLLLGLDKDVSEINVSEINNTYYYYMFWNNMQIYINRCFTIT